MKKAKKRIYKRKVSRLLKKYEQKTLRKSFKSGFRYSKAYDSFLCYKIKYWENFLDAYIFWLEEMGLVDIRAGACGLDEEVYLNLI